VSNSFVAAKPFFKPPPDEKPKVIILDSAGQPPFFHHYWPCPWKRGDLVTWWSVDYGNRLARVSRPEGPGPWDSVHIRLLRPVEVPNERGSFDRRWAFTADRCDLAEPSAIDLLADLAG